MENVMVCSNPRHFSSMFFMISSYILADAWSPAARNFMDVAALYSFSEVELINFITFLRLDLSLSMSKCSDDLPQEVLSVKPKIMA